MCVVSVCVLACVRACLHKTHACVPHAKLSHRSYRHRAHTTWPHTQLTPRMRVCNFGSCVLQAYIHILFVRALAGTYVHLYMCLVYECMSTHTFSDYIRPAMFFLLLFFHYFGPWVNAWAEGGDWSCKWEADVQWFVWDPWLLIMHPQQHEQQHRQILSTRTPGTRRIKRKVMRGRCAHSKPQGWRVRCLTT